MRTIFTLLCLLLAQSLHAATASSITVRNVTFTFDGVYTVGQYVNGDWWVVGPVTITSISPASSTTGTLSDGSAWWRSGAQLNAVPSSTGGQGFDNAMNDGLLGATYSSAANVDPGHTGGSLVVSEGTVIKAISRTNRPPQRSGSDAYTQLTDMEYLTVVVSEPAANSFRPPPVGTDKSSLWTTNDLDWSILRNLAVLSGAPTKATAEGWLVRPWANWVEGVRGRTIKASGNLPNYGRESGRLLGHGGLVLHSDVGDKTTLFLRLVQIGIDTQAVIEGSLYFLGDGGINSGWKFPALLAGMALGDTNILYHVSGGVTTPGSAPDASRLNFGFDRQSWYVLESDVDRVMTTADGKPRETYTAEHVGAAEWGEKHWFIPNKDDSRWGASYRNIAMSGEMSGVLAGILIPGGSDAWGWPATVDYLHRYMEDNPNAVGTGNNLTSWEGAMYAAYGNLGETPVEISVPTTSGVTTTTAHAAWVTTIPSATNGVHFGLSDSFGSAVTNVTAATLFPEATLTGLTPGTVYFWRAWSLSDDGDVGLSTTNQFLTVASPSNRRRGAVAAGSVTP